MLIMTIIILNQFINLKYYFKRVIIKAIIIIIIIIIINRNL